MRHVGIGAARDRIDARRHSRSGQIQRSPIAGYVPRSPRRRAVVAAALLGFGSTSRITFAVFISFFPVVVATLTGLMSVDRDLMRLCKAVGADESRIYAKVRFPAAVPHLFSGLKIAITFAMIGVIVGEFITAQAGLGYMILFAASQAEMTLIFASIVVLCVIGLVLYGLVVIAEG